MIRKRFFPSVVFILLFFISGLNSNAWSLEVNEDGKDLIRQAAQAYRDDMGDRPVITDRKFKSYINGIVNRLSPRSSAAA